MKNLLSIGQFANLCETTVNTLIHYENIGLLCPSYISDTNRRLYDTGLYHTFYIIHTMSESGIPLSEIKECLNTTTKTQLTGTLKQRELQLEQQLLYLQSIRHYFEQPATETMYPENFISGHPFIQTQSEPQLLFATLLGHHPISPITVRSALTLHKKECIKRNIYPFPLGLILQKKSLYAQNNRQVLIYSPNPTGITTNNTPIQLSGDYAVILHKGSFETINVSIELLYHFIDKHHCVVSSDTYIDFYHNSLPGTRDSYYVIKIRFCSL